MTLTTEDRSLLISHNIKKSNQAIKDAETLLKTNSLTGALNRIYYGIFYIISALAIKHQFSTSKHSQMIGWFNKNYVRNFIVTREIGKIVHDAFDKRMKGDYDILVEFDFEDVSVDLKNMKKTISVIKTLIETEEAST